MSMRSAEIQMALTNVHADQDFMATDFTTVQVWIFVLTMTVMIKLAVNRIITVVTVNATNSIQFNSIQFNSIQRASSPVFCNLYI